MQPHEILGVRPAAARAEVADAFRRFVKQHHPDHGGDPIRFRAGMDAYHRLTGRSAPTHRSRHAADVVFHRRRRPGVASVLRLAGRRLTSVRIRP